VPLVGFFTKDAVIGAVWEAGLHGHLVWPWVAWVLFGSTVLTALLTVAYSLRAWLLVFFTPPVAEPATVEEPAAEELHEAPLSMKVPLYLLTVPTVLGGFLVVFPELVFGPGEYELVHPAMAIVMTLLVALTAGVVYRQWRRSEGRDPWHPFVLPHPAVDRVYQVGLVQPIEWMARVVRAGDRDVIDGYADGAGAATRGLGWVLRRAQAGNVQTYLMVVVVGACAVAVAAGVVA
jgi:NADH-quinone oxidoreductase subunit L